MSLVQPALGRETTYHKNKSKSEISQTSHIFSHILNLDVCVCVCLSYKNKKRIMRWLEEILR